MDVNEELQRIIDRAFGDYANDDVIVLDETIVEDGDDC